MAIASAEMSLRPLGVHHIAVQVRDLARMERFYRDVLGLAVLRRWPAAASDGERSVWLDLGRGSFLALERVANGGDEAVDLEGQPGLYLVALQIEAGARASWAERLAAAGHPVYKATSYTLYARDPEGNRLGLSHFPEPRLDALRDV